MLESAAGARIGPSTHNVFARKSDPRMTNSQRLAQVRKHLLSWLDRQPLDDSAAADATPIERESVLIVDGFYCGRRFHAGNYRATWFIEEDELKIHDQDGKLLCVFGSAELDSSVQAAAQTTAQAAADECSEQAQDIIAMPTPQAARAAGIKHDDDEIRRAA
jgi:hypothetical protein